MNDLNKLVAQFFGGDPIAGSTALHDLVALGDRGEDALFSRRIGRPETTQMMRRWLRYVASRSDSAGERMLHRLKNGAQFTDNHSMVRLFAGIGRNDEILSSLEKLIAAGFRHFDPEGMDDLFLAWGYAGGHPDLLWLNVRGGGYAWEKLKIFAFRGACASVARTGRGGAWLLGQLLKHRCDDSAGIEKVPRDAIDSGEPISQAIETFGPWRHGDIADEVLGSWSIDEHWRIRDFGARILDAFSFRRTAARCVEWLRSEPSRTVRDSLLGALATSETTIGADALVDHFETHREGQVHVAKAAWRARDKDRAIGALSAIVDMARTSQPNAEAAVVAEALVSLARLGHRHALLVGMLDGSVGYTRLNAALAAAYLKDESRVDQIRSMQRETAAPMERIFLSVALAMLGWQDGPAQLHEELVNAASEGGIDIFRLFRSLQRALKDGLDVGGEQFAEQRNAWLGELQPLDLVARRVDLTASPVPPKFNPPDLGRSDAPDPDGASPENHLAGNPSHNSRRGRERVLQASEPKILIVTALPKELAAVIATLDHVERPSSAPGDPNIYRLGTYAVAKRERRVRIATQAVMGKTNSSTLGADALRSFPGIDHILMVGIAGGCPNPDRPEDHVRLGDVVVSNHKGIVEYDNVKRTDIGAELRSDPQRPSLPLLQAHNILTADMLSGERPWEIHLEHALQKPGIATSFSRPDDASDVLHDGDTRVEHPHDAERRSGWPRVFGGAIGTADTLLKDPAMRDLLRDRLHVRAIEMEASGLQTAAWARGKDIMVVRGICDYCDKWKSDRWQNYAALAAAAYARALIEVLPDEWFA